jgi:ankyrin repeat protein
MIKLDKELDVACRNDDLASVKRLLEKGADINGQNDGGNTILHYCASFGRLSMCKHLIRNGANVLIKNKRGETAYDMAKQRLVVPVNLNSLKIANLLKSHIMNNIAKKVKDKLNDIEL